MIHENFLLEKVLKDGPRGRVSLLRHRESRQRMIARRFAGSGQAYRQMMALSCPHLPRVEACAEQDGQVLVLEEYIPGDSLAFVLQGGPLRPAQARQIAADVARALSALHRLSVVHRDVKPENILLDGDRAVLIDFDASRVCKEEADADTRIMGTTGYAAPEQFGLSQTDARADIYSLGVLINEMLTLQHPSRRLADGPLRPIIEKCIEVNVDKRYRSADELLSALLRKRPPLSAARRERLFFAFSSAILLGTVLFLAGALLRPQKASSETLSATAVSGDTVTDSFDSSHINPDAPVEDVQLVQLDANQSYTSFTCDLDGDGQPENYAFCVYMNFAGPGSEILSPSGTDSTTVPEGMTHGETFTPIVLRQVAYGYEFAEEFAPLLEQAQLTVVPVYQLDSGSPTLEDADPLYGIWSGSRYISYTSDCTGLWLYEASAVLDGHSLTATTASAINLVSMPSSELSLAAATPQTFLGVTRPDAPVTSLSTISDGDNGLHHTKFTCDLDGDGQDETYTFRIGFSVNGSYPTPVSRDDRLLVPNNPTTHVFVPAVFMETDNGLESADHFQDLLEDIELTLVCLRSDGGGSPQVSDALPLSGWQNGKQITYSTDCAGLWQYEATAVFNGQTLTAAAITNIQIANS